MTYTNIWLRLLNFANDLNAQAGNQIQQGKRLKPFLLLLAAASIAYPILGLSTIMLKLGFR